ncbi:hypothetical protein ACSRUE_01790 [Sorangium sp. KYC3313]|uniref:hypothetical protein n=1 Tax=Sorangium sp. KYC3313 TaxID=3449740 RepID=UPI003F88702B
MSAHFQGKAYEQWFRDLRITDAPLTRRGLVEALDFFHQRMPGLDRRTMLAFLRGMDLHRPVKRVLLQPNSEIAAFRRSTESPFKLFYTKVGANLHSLGVNPHDRRFQRFRVRALVEVLESYAAPVVDTWSELLPVGVYRHYTARGGGIQYVIPGSYDCLLVAV